MLTYPCWKRRSASFCEPFRRPFILVNPIFHLTNSRYPILLLRNPSHILDWERRAIPLALPGRGWERVVYGAGLSPPFLINSRSLDISFRNPCSYCQSYWIPYLST